MPIILLENDGLKSHVKEVIRQLLEANDEAAKELGTTIEPRFKITFSVTTVSLGGLNAVQRPAESRVADQFTDSTEEPVTSVTESVRSGEQLGESNSKLDVLATQSQSSRDSTATTGKVSQAEKNSGISKAVEASTTTANDTAKETANSKQSETNSKVESNNTKQETTTEYVQS